MDKYSILALTQGSSLHIMKYKNELLYSLWFCVYFITDLLHLLNEVVLDQVPKTTRVPFFKNIKKLQ